MHELSVCLALIEQVERIAAERGANRVTRICLDLGPLSGVEAELLERAYPLAANGSIADGAELVVNKTELVVHCSECDSRTAVPPNRLICGQCRGFRTCVVAGEELLLRSVELELADSPSENAGPSATASPYVS